MGWAIKLVEGDQALQLLHEWFHDLIQLRLVHVSGTRFGHHHGNLGVQLITFVWTRTSLFHRSFIRKEMAKQDLLDMKAKQLEEKEKDVKKLQRKLQRQTPSFIAVFRGHLLSY